MSDFNLGDRVWVTGDTASAGHEFTPSTVGVIREDWGGDWSEGDEYHVVSESDEDESWWVNAADLVKVDSAPQTSHAMFLAATRTVLDLNLPEHVKTVIIKAMVDAL